MYLDFDGVLMREPRDVDAMLRAPVASIETLVDHVLESLDTGGVRDPGAP